MRKIVLEAAKFSWYNSGCKKIEKLFIQKCIIVLGYLIVLTHFHNLLLPPPQGKILVQLGEIKRPPKGFIST